MQILGADFLALCDKNFTILKEGGICFEKDKIVEIDTYANLCKKYPTILAQYEDSCVITPALANLHLHLEFNQNEGLLHFGDFGEWLDSVLTKREQLMALGLQASMQKGVQECLQSGVGFIGAISSHGYDLEILANAPLRVLYFNEAIGSNPQSLDFLYQNFLARFEDSKAKKSERFFPAVAVHAPYSVHPKLLEKVIKLAKEQKVPLSVHLLESFAEREWLESSSGYFKEFYQKFFQKKMESFYAIKEFLMTFKELDFVYFTHCVEANKEELEFIKEQRAKIITCPKSNRLLNNKMLNLNAIREIGIPLCIGTDGKSSNDSLSLLDELRIALFAYPNIPLESLARELLLGATRNAFLDSALSLGTLKIGNLADFAVFKLPKLEQFLAQHLILYARKAHRLFIGGEEVALESKE